MAKGGLRWSSFIESLSWQDYGLLIIFVIFLFLQVGLVSEFQQLPSPIYGGDYFHQLGGVNHVRYGGQPFKSFTNEVATPNYSPMYSLIVGNLLKIFPMNSIRMMYLFSFLLMFLSMLVIYLFANHIFKDKTLALIAVLLFSRLEWWPVVKYREFALYLIWPLLFFALYKMLETRRYKWGVVSGLIFGFGCLSHSAFFTMVTLLVPFLLLFMYYNDFKRKGLKFVVDRRAPNHKPILLLAVFYFTGFVIALPYWYYPIFVYLGKLPNPATFLRQHNFAQWGAIGEFLWGYIYGLFLYFGTIVGAIQSILMIISTAFLFLFKKFKFRERFIVMVYLAALIIPLHFLLTVPILGTHLDPFLMRVFFFALLPAFLIPLGIMGLKQLFKKIEFMKFLPYIILGLLLIGNIVDFNAKAKNDQWYKVGRSPTNQVLLDTSAWIIGNTGVEDTFITTKEVGSAINALTGRKFVCVRDNQESLISDIFTRQAELAVILYGNNSELTKQLLKKYDVKYLYWDFYWFNSEYVFDEQGKFTRYYDPLIVLDSPAAREYFKKNGVLYRSEKMVTDPSKRGQPYIPLFDLLVAWPPELDQVHPWSSTLDEFLNEAKSFDYNGQLLGRIFAVDYQ